jgi:hypothetical protein
VRVEQGRLTVNRVRDNATQITGGTLRIADGPVGHPDNTSVFGDGGYSQTGGRLDLNRSGAIFDYDTALTSPIGTIAALIASGYAGNTWSGNGITSSAAAANPAGHAVGFAEASAIGSPASFLGQSVDSTSVLVRYTRRGDANLDGITNIADFSLLSANFNQTGSTWSRGDFNFDGVTSIADFSVLAANFNQAATGATLRGSAVPEPASLVAFIVALLLCGRRRKR